MISPSRQAPGSKLQCTCSRENSTKSAEESELGAHMKAPRREFPEGERYLCAQPTGPLGCQKNRMGKGIWAAFGQVITGAQKQNNLKLKLQVPSLDQTLSKALEEQIMNSHG